MRAPTPASAADLAACRENAPADAAASTTSTVAVEPAPVLSDAKVAEQEAKLDSYLRALGMIDGPGEASAGVDALM